MTVCNFYGFTLALRGEYLTVTKEGSSNFTHYHQLTCFYFLHPCKYLNKKVFKAAESHTKTWTEAVCFLEGYYCWQIGTFFLFALDISCFYSTAQCGGGRNAGTERIGMTCSKTSSWPGVKLETCSSENGIVLF